MFFYYSTLFDSRFKTLQQNPKNEIETACSTALNLASLPSVKIIQTILKGNKQKRATSQSHIEDTNIEKHGFTRGASYFGGK
ncbi:hypothetical protein OMA_05934 [Enterococcus faecium EnGen0045]|nr:hypothetical protein OMA_05934 [Enterococcus faecium EnGen0045]ELB80203.1 hypothetical protein OMC_05874 [Enterococcus faecium EnGen0049]MWG21359.1 hypothetical protein [Enterococcus faecium]